MHLISAQNNDQENASKQIAVLNKRITELEDELLEANSIVDAIKEGNIDAFILNKEGRSDIYALENIDYTYRVLIEKFGEGAISISEDGLILYCNEYFAQLLNIPSSKLIGTYFNSYVFSVGQFQSLLEGLKTGFCKGEILLSANGVKIPVYISITSLQPHVPAIGIIVTDRTEKKKHEEEIERYQQKLERKIRKLNQSNSDLEQFVHIVSHDIKEPLRKIVSYGGRLKEEISDDLNEKSSKYLNIIYDGALRLNSLVDALVIYSGSTSRRFDVTNIDIYETIKEVCDDIELIIREKKAQISFAALPIIKASHFQMKQLFANLIINALKYSKENVNPIIDIKAEIVDHVDEKFPSLNYYKISISDNGIGMEQQYLKKIFTIFQRLHLPHEYSGTGIGLAICKKIIENHNGHIEVQSSLGRGSTFIIYLPA
ncbi:MAG: PAS domain-containing protein [Bacteroidetes bacterium]|nr:PAS domain-containing protein [Bacteroidota bacterium]